jgi:hypothetical protein
VHLLIRVWLEIKKKKEKRKKGREKRDWRERDTALANKARKFCENERAASLSLSLSLLV